MDTSQLGLAPLQEDAGAQPSPYAFLAEPALSPDQLGEVWSKLPYSRIGMERSSCASGCPEYTLAFIRGRDADTHALARYQGLRNVDRVGVFEGSISLREYAQLCQLFDAAGFLSLEPEYRASWTGDATATVIALSGSNYHEVADTAGQGPLGLVGLELALDGRAQGVAWQTVLDEVPADEAQADAGPTDPQPSSGT